MIYVKESCIWCGDIKVKKYPCQSYQEAVALVNYLIHNGCQGALHICSLINNQESYL